MQVRQAKPLILQIIIKKKKQKKQNHSQGYNLWGRVSVFLPPCLCYLVVIWTSCGNCLVQGTRSHSLITSCFPWLPRQFPGRCFLSCDGCPHLLSVRPFLPRHSFLSSGPECSVVISTQATSEHLVRLPLLRTVSHALARSPGISQLAARHEALPT